MDELKLDTTERFPVTVDGKRMEFRLPMLSEQIEYEKKMKEVSSDTETLFNLNTDFLVSLGGDREVLSKIPSKYFLMILDGLVSFSKKK